MTVDLDVVTRMANTYASHAYQQQPRAEDLQPLSAVYEEVVEPLLAQVLQRPPSEGGDGDGDPPITAASLERARQEGAEQALAAVWRYIVDQQCRLGGCLRGDLRNWLRARLDETVAGERLALDTRQQRLDLIRCLTEEWEHPRRSHGTCEYARGVQAILEAPDQP